MNATRRPGRLWIERPLRFFLLALAAALFLALASRGVRWAASTQGITQGACWIWADGIEVTGHPVAFYATSDIELAAAAPATLSIAADEGYEVWVNGRLVGSGVYRPPAAFDLYRLDDILRAGSNRLTVRLQSLRGPGGLLAMVRSLESEQTLAVTDADWRIYREHDPRLFEAGQVLDGGEIPTVWQRAPTGRWRVRPADSERPVVSSARLPARQVRDFFPDAKWFDLQRPRKSPIRFLRMLYDWGEEVTGRLTFEMVGANSGPALAYFGAEIPDPAVDADPAALLFVPGQATWRDVQSRRFRYVLLVGTEPVKKVWAEPAVSDDETLTESPVGLWGIQPPPRPATIREEVWQRVEAEARERAGRG